MQVHNVRVETVSRMSTGVDQRVHLIAQKDETVSKMSTGVDGLYILVVNTVSEMSTEVDIYVDMFSISC